MLREPEVLQDATEVPAQVAVGSGPAGSVLTHQRQQHSWITRGRIKWGAVGIVGLFLVLILLLTITAPLSKSLQPISAPSLTLLSAEGVPIARRGAVVDAPVDAARLPKRVTQPFIAIEDRRFYSHLGVDPQGLGRALAANLRHHGVVEGGSTITQQLAKLSFLSPEQTMSRKLQEIVLAFWLEARLGKNEILSRYLSSVYFGDNVFGLRAAAKHYFSREPEELSVEQAALLAGLLKAPTTLAPTHSPRRAWARQQVVIQAMVAAGMLSQGEARRLPAPKLRVGGFKDVPTGSYFADWVLPQVEEAINHKYPAHVIRTTLEDRLQREAVGAIRSVGTGGAQVALVAMRPDGRVVAMVGGNSYERSPFNRATQALREPGSTFKLFVYLTALEAGYTPQSQVLDAPVKVGNWTPDNHGDAYRGEITLHQAFAVSSNVAAVRLAEAVGRDKVTAMARRLGVTAKLEPGPTMTLGTSGIPLMQMVGAYAAVAAGRYPIHPHGLARDGDGDASIRMDPRVRAQMLELLAAVVNEGTGRGARLATPTFGKTGTSQDSRNAYFIGFSGDLITGVWIGYDDNRPMPGAQGGGVPAAIWRAFMSQALGTRAQAAPPAPADNLPAEPFNAQQMPAVVREYDVEEQRSSDREPRLQQPDAPAHDYDDATAPDAPREFGPDRTRPRSAPPPPEQYSDDDQAAGEAGAQ